MYNSLPLIKCLIFDTKLFSLPSEVNSLKHGYTLIFMEFVKTPMNRTLNKVFLEVGFKPAIKGLKAYCLSRPKHQALMIIEVE